MKWMNFVILIGIIGSIINIVLGIVNENPTALLGWTSTFLLWIIILLFLTKEKL